MFSPKPTYSFLCFVYLILNTCIFSIQAAPFDFGPCYSPAAATLSSVLFDFKNKAPFKRIPISHPQNKKELIFKVYEPIPGSQAYDNDEWIFVFAGIGTGVDDAHAVKAASLLREVGIEKGLLIIPSVFRLDFAQSFSSQGIVGNIPTDAQDLLFALELLKDSSKEYQFKEITYFGFSLGALTAAHLSSQLEKSQHPLMANKVILMNSPINLLKSLQNIDRLNEKRVSLYENTQVAISYLSYLSKYPSAQESSSLQCELYQIEESSLESVISESLKFNLDELFLYGQERTPTGALDRRPRHYLRSPRERERMQRLRDRRMAKNLSFENYVKNSVLPISQVQELSELNQRVSLTSLSNEIRNNPKYYVIHTRDDFLQSSERELNQYTNLFLPENKWIVDKGGHLGLLNFRELGEVIKDFLQK